jgi:hypothetical protein
MSHRTTSQLRSWGFAAVTTIAALIALCVGCGTGVALFWATTYNEPAALAHTLVLLMAVADIALIVLISVALYRSYRRPS